MDMMREIQGAKARQRRSTRPALCEVVEVRMLICFENWERWPARACGSTPENLFLQGCNALHNELGRFGAVATHDNLGGLLANNGQSHGGSR